MSPAVMAVVTLVPLLIGWIAGRRFERAARGWSDYRGRKAELPILRAAARALSARASSSVLVAAAIAVFTLYLLAVEGVG